ncbi:M48 family metalloprotease [Curvibacter sp. APW13]|uniref:M48 family metalloprotease n=1 Tax=Curvibacter sp. APW13 TaxID=3077236 RepID=UPI0028DE1848|nr:M48 family metalloprotease [Curvibacter sp. APW13]MDT8990137.1 M48 family metalloprotease [Curvibacter sp. APW13]
MQAQNTSAGMNLPNLGDGTEMTPAAERHLGDRVARELFRDPDYIDDPILLDYVQTIWTRLMDAARRRGELQPELDEAYAWQILMGKDRSINAFALPGAYFGIHLGLIAAVSSRDELAAVMGHELSHVTQRHIARLMARQGAQAPWLMAAMILGALAASGNPQGATAVIAGGQAVAAQSQLNFSRDMEREADRVGFGVAVEAGFAPLGFVRMFERLQHATRLSDNGSFPYLRSHPLSTERIADAQGRVGVTAPRADLEDAEALLMAARAKVLSDSSVDALQGWQLSVVDATGMARRTPARQAAQWYGAALAATKSRQPALAQRALAALRSLAPGQSGLERQIRLLAAEMALEGLTATPADALAQLAPLGNARSVLLLRARAQIATGQGAVAAQALQLWLAAHPQDATAWRQLAAANHASQRVVAAVRAEAEADAAQMDYGAAVQRLKSAQELARQRQRSDEHFEASIVDTRLRQLEQLVREQALER